MHMTCDNDCTRAGWIEAIVSNGATDLHISHAPDADLDGTFSAFCHDEQEMIRVNGWQMSSYEPIAPDVKAARCLSHAALIQAARNTTE